MKIAFSTQIGGQQNYFVEKILAGLSQTGKPEIEEFIAKALAGGLHPRKHKRYVYEVNRSALAICHPKVHTIRKDESNRWEAGKLIHPVILNRTTNEIQFAPTMKCCSVQVFSIEYQQNRPECQDIIVKVDGRRLLGGEVGRLARYDGFSDALEFFKYFDCNFTGKIIHWTDLRY